MQNKVIDLLVDQTEQLLKALSAQSGSQSFIQLHNLKAKTAVDEIEQDLIQSFTDWRNKIDASHDFVAVRFYWAGAEVEPFIPSDVWSYAYGGSAFNGIEGKAKKVFFKEQSAFAPQALIALVNNEAGPLPAPLFDAVKSLFVTSSLCWAAMALWRLKDHPSFKALKPKLPFNFIATPGHDEEPVLLCTLE